MEDQLQEAQEKYYSTQNRVNMQVVFQHKLRQEEKLFTQELAVLSQVKESIQKGRGDSSYLSRAVIAQDQYLRGLIQENHSKIKELQRRLEGSELSGHSQRISNIHESFSKVLNGQLEKKTRETMSLLRGRVEEMKKKTKQLLKEIQGLQQAQKGYIDEFSVQTQHLQQEQSQIRKLEDQLRQKKDQDRKVD